MQGHGGSSRSSGKCNALKLKVAGRFFNLLPMDIRNLTNINVDTFKGKLNNLLRGLVDAAGRPNEGNSVEHRLLEMRRMPRVGPAT